MFDDLYFASTDAALEFAIAVAEAFPTLSVDPFDCEPGGSFLAGVTVAVFEDSERDGEETPAQRMEMRQFRAWVKETHPSLTGLITHAE